MIIGTVGFNRFQFKFKSIKSDLVNCYDLVSSLKYRNTYYISYIICIFLEPLGYCVLFNINHSLGREAQKGVIRSYWSSIWFLVELKKNHQLRLGSKPSEQEIICSIETLILIEQSRQQQQ